MGERSDVVPAKVQRQKFLGKSPHHANTTVPAGPASPGGVQPSKDNRDSDENSWTTMISDELVITLSSQLGISSTGLNVHHLRSRTLPKLPRDHLYHLQQSRKPAVHKSRQKDGFPNSVHLVFTNVAQENTNRVHPSPPLLIYLLLQQIFHHFHSVGQGGHMQRRAAPMIHQVLGRRFLGLPRRGKFGKQEGIYHKSFEESILMILILDRIILCWALGKKTLDDLHAATFWSIVAQDHILQNSG